MKKKICFFIGGALTACILFLLQKYIGAGKLSETLNDTLTIVTRDTLRVPQPAVTSATLIRVDTVWLRPTHVVSTAESGHHDLDTIVDLWLDEFSQADNTAGSTFDNVAVEVPITQKTYNGEGYRAWVSGYATQLDSIWIERHEIERTVLTREKKSRWGLSVSAGAAVTPRGIEPYLGVGVSYTFISL